MRRTILVAGAAAIAAGAFVLTRHRGRGPEAPTSSMEDLQYTLFAPGGPQGFLFNGPVGWAFAKIQPLSHAGVYTVVAEVLDLQREDELLDIGCGPGAFLATKTGHVRRVVGLDPSLTMLHESGKRLADRIAMGTARLVQGSAAELPFADGEFSVVTAITAPANLAEVPRVLRPGGRFVWVDELAADPRKPSSSRTGSFGWTEADFRRVLEDAGFTDLAVNHKGVWFIADNRILACRKPASSSLRNAVAAPAAAPLGADAEEAAAVAPETPGPVEEVVL